MSLVRTEELGWCSLLELPAPVNSAALPFGRINRSLPRPQPSSTARRALVTAAKPRGFPNFRQNGSKFAAQGLQTAAVVPLMCDEPGGYKTFRIGLFGLDRLRHIDAPVENLERALARIAHA